MAAAAEAAEVKLQSALEMLNLGLSHGVFTSAERNNEQGVQSASANRASDKRAREESDENEEEEQADPGLFEDAGEVATTGPKPASKNVKGAQVEWTYLSSSARNPDAASGQPGGGSINASLFLIMEGMNRQVF
ncbi:hypothetical protein CYMTET_54982 [Cymbomonas tetramitiformis]|uniref:Uncharacterized protein n=1 Tax=Cymbomonas tetramitiformis TaxID=36881 RepID=A0AAE0BDU6_9CHLO|nr:hypothetical protein CYMTET_54982 [Cymbomonas tetramitiformis]